MTCFIWGNQFIGRIRCVARNRCPCYIDEKKGDKNQYMGCGWKRSAKQNEIKFI